MYLPESQFLIVVGGPTAVGKTSMAVKIAEKYQTEIISADSRQLYKELNCGTAKPSIEEQEAIRHHFVDHISIHQPYTAGDFEREASDIINKLFETHRITVVVGGSGLYINAIVHGLDKLPEIDADIRIQLNETLRSEGIEVLLRELAEVDPNFYRTVDRKNHRRIVRALEVYRASSVPFSEFRTRETSIKPYQTLMIGLEMERTELYDQINKRVDRMIENGLISEAESLLPFRNLPALKTVGYSEFFDYFNGKYDLEEAIRLVKRNSRRYAKRQYTWFKNQEKMRWFQAGDQNGVLAYINKVVSDGQ